MHEPFAALAHVRLNNANGSERTLDSTDWRTSTRIGVAADDVQRRPRAGARLAVDGVDVGRTLPLGSPSIRLAVARSMPLETLLLPSSVGHMLQLGTLLWTCGIEKASALDTLLTTRRVELQLATTSPVLTERCIKRTIS
ncbi:hypothetical protein PR001_g425 [Phytophthora rubi]|uniref:Uncharacterized protein n=1 Tax=Phytophthora rubi TaxID=129364 RepID=A0A6A3P3D1_9STRA|nr:hypothetical protein PR001_g425 [Phytophthora rubi]